MDYSLSKKIVSFWDDKLPLLDKRRLVGFDNCTSCVRREVLLEIPFEDVEYGEDFTWAKKVLKKSYKIVYCQDATVFYYHSQNFWYSFKRNFIDQSITKRYIGLIYIPNIRGLFLFILGESVKIVSFLLGIRDLKLKEKFYWILYNVKLTVGKGIGFYLGKMGKNRRISNLLKIK